MSFVIVFCGLIWSFADSKAQANSNQFSWSLFYSLALTGDSQDEECGEKVLSAKLYEDVSLYSLIGGFALLILGILVDQKIIKTCAFSLAFIPLAAWVFVNFFIDFEKVKRMTFNYDLVAENTLANIAEAQDRYKSEHDTFLKDLNKLYSHMAGAHGISKCVKIISLEAEWNHWSARAKHVSSPRTVTWDGRTGSSLKKG